MATGADGLLLFEAARRETFLREGFLQAVDRETNYFRLKLRVLTVCAFLQLASGVGRNVSVAA